MCEFMIIYNDQNSTTKVKIENRKLNKIIKLK